MANEMRDRLVELIRSVQYLGGLEEKLADHLIENGVVVPPCKVGAEIFGLFDNDDKQRKEIYEGKVFWYSLDENNLLWAKIRYKNGLTYWHTIDDFGKTVFLTKFEAKQKLKEMRGE